MNARRLLPALAIFVLISGAVLLTACSGQAAAQNSTGQATPGPDDAGLANTPTAAPVAPELPAKPIPGGFPDGSAILYEKTGGFAGVMENWTIYLDGRIVSADGQQKQVPAQEVADLLNKIDTWGFFELKHRFMPLDTCCDRYTYVLSVQYNGKSHSVTVLEAAPDVPQALWDILEAIQALVQRPAEQ